jgi:predicted DNA-binding transcriptional regulator AlpA
LARAFAVNPCAFGAPFVALVRRLAAHYPDAVIAGKIAKSAGPPMVIVSPPISSAVSAATGTFLIFKRPSSVPDGELVNIRQAAVALGVAASTVHRWLNEGIIAGEQLTPRAPWRIRLTEDLLALVAQEAPEGYLTVYQTMRLLRVSRQTVWQRVKRGVIKAIHVARGRKKGQRLKVINAPKPF